MSRTEFNPNPSVSELTRELQVLVPRWRRDAALRDREPRERDSFLRDRELRERDSSHRDRDRDRDRLRHPPLARAADTPPAERAPLSSSYDKYKIGLKLHPVTNKLTRCYTKPNGSVIFLSRNCSSCNEAHFDFEHDSIRHPAAAARFTLNESGYELWDWDSDTATDDQSTKKLN